MGTSLSSSGHKGRTDGSRAAAPTERHLLLCARNGRCPFICPLPSSIISFALGVSQHWFMTGKQWFLSQTCAFVVVHFTTHSSQKWQVPSCQTTEVSHFLPSFFENVACRCAPTPPTAPTVPQFRLKAPQWSGPLTQGFGGRLLPPRGSARGRKGRARASLFDSSTHRVCW